MEHWSGWRYWKQKRSCNQHANPHHYARCALNSKIRSLCFSITRLDNHIFFTKVLLLFLRWYWWKLLDMVVMMDHRSVWRYINETIWTKKQWCNQNLNPHHYSRCTLNRKLRSLCFFHYHPFTIWYFWQKVVFVFLRWCWWKLLDIVVMMDHRSVWR